MAATQLGHTYKLQEQNDQAIESYLRALELQSSPEIANEVGNLYVKKGNWTLALEYCSYAIDMSSENVLSIDPELLAKFYSDRVKIYEKLNMFEHARND